MPAINEILVKKGELVCCPRFPNKNVFVGNLVVEELKKDKAFMPFVNQLRNISRQCHCGNECVISTILRALENMEETH